MKANLEMVKAAINNNTSIIVEIRNIYIDYGANWREDAIVSVYPREYQVLSPRQVQDANAGMLSIDELQEIIDDINTKGW